MSKAATIVYVPVVSVVVLGLAIAVLPRPWGAGSRTPL